MQSQVPGFGVRRPPMVAGRIRAADGGYIGDPASLGVGSVTRTGNSYSGGNVSGPISVNGQAPGGTFSTIGGGAAPAPAPAVPAAPSVSPTPAPPPFNPATGIGRPNALGSLADTNAQIESIRASYGAPALGVKPPAPAATTAAATPAVSTDAAPRTVPAPQPQPQFFVGGAVQPPAPAPAPAPVVAAPAAPPAAPAAPPAPFTNRTGGASQLVAYRDGGVVHGPGTGTSDSVPAMLSKGEVVMPADTVRALGAHNLLAAIDATHTPVGLGVRKHGRPGFADGGMVLDPRYGVAGVPASTQVVVPAQPVPPGSDLIARRPPINMGAADVVRPVPAAVSSTGASVAVPPAAPGPGSEIIGRRPPINMGMADVVGPEQVSRAAPSSASAPAVRPAPSQLPAPAAASAGGAPITPPGGGQPVAQPRPGGALVPTANAAPQAATPLGPAATAVSRLSKVVAPAGAIAGIAGAAQSFDDMSTGRRDAFINSVGADPSSVPQTLAADSARVLANVGDAATFGLAGRLGRGIAEGTSGGSFVDGFVGRTPSPPLPTSSGRGAPEIPTGSAPALPPAAASGAEQAEVRGVDHAIAASSAPTPTPAPASFEPAGSLGFVEGGVSAADRLARLNRDAEAQRGLSARAIELAQQGVGGPTPGLGVIGPVDYANRNADFNDGAAMRTLIARGAPPGRNGAQVYAAQLGAAEGPLARRASMAALGVREAGDTQRALIQEQGVDARTRAQTAVQQQQLGIERQKLALDSSREDRQVAAAQTEQAQKARVAQLDTLILNGTPIQQKAAAAQKAAILGKGMDTVTKTGEVSTAIRKEFESLPEVKNYKQALPSFRGIEDAVKRNTPMSDINIVYGIAKLYDPTSVVREGEYATVANAPGMPERVKGWVSYVAGGGKLTDEVKKQILTEARSRMGTFDKEYAAARTQYSDIAQRSGADATLVVPQNYKPLFEAPAAAAAPIPPRESLVAGQTYQTARGTAIWDGKQFTSAN